MKKHNRVVFLGDSITLGYGLENQSDRFATVFCRMIGAEEINYGITGTLMARAGLSASDGTASQTRRSSMSAMGLHLKYSALPGTRPPSSAALTISVSMVYR